MGFSKSEVISSVDDCIKPKVDYENFWKLDSSGIKDEMMGCDDLKAMTKFVENVSYKDRMVDIIYLGLGKMSTLTFQKIGLLQ